ncbi:hypothetical protein GCK72_021188 [Caenorhabditis remanei]|uniref:SCP domain-containing protein n=1 Tax=Caenorhabditis remanei TaxID=31234 RepID=A0A6A5GJ75_CAERE|nr:hypothetical protein GCK72_021188 [Caenorhabditis remanei]KAF1754625.1 hypothetical protein GCK72_021188 [Caenorhabditis remanei]
MTTKSILLCASLLGIAFLVVSADDSEEIRTLTQLPKEECDNFVKNLNDKKREMIKELNLADGYELAWDPEIVKKISEELAISDVIFNSKSGSWFLADTFDKLIQVSAKELASWDYVDPSSMNNIESLLSPIHRKIGCVGLTTNNYRIYCFLTPGYLIKDPAGGMHHTYVQSYKGVPGTKCADGYANHDGLCALIGSFTTEKPFTKPPGIDVTDATDVTSGSSSTCFRIGFLLFVVSYYSSY